VSLALLSASMWGQTAQAPEPTAGVAPAAETRAPSAKVDVTYVNGQLTIKGNDAPLIDVLRATCKQIGAELDAQAEPTDPVSGTLGPGVAKEVLETLLSDAHVNYALGGTARDPSTVANVAIFPQTKDSGVGTQGAQEQTGRAPDNSAAATAPVKSGGSQLLELFESAKTELASGANLDVQSDDAESGSDAKQVNLTAVLQQIEAQVKAAEQSASSTSQNQQRDSAPSDTAPPDSNLVHPTHRPMHRKHH
jgi:hypothetical protein